MRIASCSTGIMKAALKGCAKRQLCKNSTAIWQGQLMKSHWQLSHPADHFATYLANVVAPVECNPNFGTSSCNQDHMGPKPTSWLTVRTLHQALLHVVNICSKHPCCTPFHTTVWLPLLDKIFQMQINLKMALYPSRNLDRGLGSFTVSTGTGRSSLSAPLP